MDIYTRPGRKVIFTGCNGHDHQREHANKVLSVGQAYTVKYIDVHSFCSYVELEEVPGEFNSVMFDDFRLDDGK